MTVATERASRGSPGFGVSGQRAARAARDRVDDRARICGRAAEPIEDGERIARTCSDPRTVGPDPITLRSSPTTSEIASVRHAARDAGRQPSALDRRRVLAHGVQRVDVGAGAQQRLRRRAACRRGRMPSAGAAISADAPPDSSTSSCAASGSASHRARTSRPARLAAGAGHRMARLTTTSGGSTAACATLDATTRPPRTRAPSSALRGARHRRRRLAGRHDHTMDGRSALRSDRRARHGRARPRSAAPMPAGDEPGDPVGDCRASVSVCVFGIGPGGKPGHDVELLEEGADELVGVVFRTETARVGP